MNTGQRKIFVTYCDHNYLPRAIAMVESLRRVGSDDEVWIYCLTKPCLEALQKLQLSGVRAIPLDVLEVSYPALPATKRRRTTIEYYYTCSPLVIKYTFLADPTIEFVTYLDSDLWFFSDPRSIFDKIGDAPVSISPHNFPRRLQNLERFGIFNVGWITFRRCDQGLTCLAWWRDRCLEWCYGRIDGERFGDQGYLNSFSQIAPDTNVIALKGCNTAPWNIENYDVSITNTVPYVDDEPIIVFHFHGVKRALSLFYFDSHRHYGAPHSGIIRNFIYRPYINSLIQAEKRVRAFLPNAGGNGVRLRGELFLGFDVKNFMRAIRARVFQLADLISGRPVVVLNGRVY